MLRRLIFYIVTIVWKEVMSPYARQINLEENSRFFWNVDKLPADYTVSLPGRRLKDHTNLIIYRVSLLTRLTQSHWLITHQYGATCWSRDALNGWQTTKLQYIQVARGGWQKYRKQIADKYGDMDILNIYCLLNDALYRRIIGC